MRTAIFAAEIPNSTDNRPWMAYLAGIDGVMKNVGVEQIADNVWQVDFQKAPAALAQLIFAAHRQNLAYKILPFPDAPQWILGGPTAKS